jgi:hypothetical protein
MSEGSCARPGFAQTCSEGYEPVGRAVKEVTDTFTGALLTAPDR